jgi:hypothetical protein
MAGASFEPGPENPQPLSGFSGNTPATDPLSVLPPGVPQQRWLAVDQRADDAQREMISFDDLHELSLDILAHEKRIAALVGSRAENGFELDETAPQVLAEREKLNHAVARRDRLRGTQEVRSARFSRCGQLRRTVADWLLRGGVPSNCRLVAVEDEPVTKMLRRNETLAKLYRDTVHASRKRQKTCAASSQHHGLHTWSRRALAP